MSNDKIQAPVRKYKNLLQDMIPLKQPLRVLIDPCDVCNFRCEFCFQNFDKNFKGSMMSTETFEIIVDNLKEFEEPVNIIHFYTLGEPLMNKNLPSFIKTVKENNLSKETAITTNGSLFTEKLSEELIDAGIGRISISLNGICDEDFERVANKKISFAKLYEQIKYLSGIRGNCHLHIKINGECFSKDAQEKFIELFSNYADTINIDHVANCWPGLEIANAENNINLYDIAEFNALQNGGGRQNKLCLSQNVL